ncbi:MAG: gamma-glutamyltransferase [Planctomycetaceae bacterium]|nr:gamma-glutamyltransferase [Planctomycetaceae bacterium]
MRIASLALAMMSLLATSSLWAGDRFAGRPFVTRSPAVGANGMAATSQPLATLAAIDILRAGGNAVDAAIAANAVLCVTEPISCGIGGDLFAIVWDNDSGKLYGLNGSGRSPQGLTAEEFQRLGHQRVPSYGPLPITVPGCVDGWCTLHKRFGKLPLEQVLAPAIVHARDGYVVTEVIAHYWAVGAAVHEEHPGFADVFMPGGKAPRHGDLFRNPALASTLDKIADGGADAFYRGAIARGIDSFMRDIGGYLRYDDLAAHRSEWVEPVSVEYAGHEVWELPPNGQGIAALQMLQILKHFDLRTAGFGSPGHLHYLVEAKKLAFEDRARFYADPAFYDAPVGELISAEYAGQRASLIQPNAAGQAFAAGNPALRDGDTVYLTTADRDRNMVSLIQSNYRGFGAGPCPPGMGFCFQDRGELFDLTPGQANSYAPGKRPFHTIIPAFVTKAGRPVMSFGVMGGDMQPQGHVQILLNLFEFDMGLQEAGDAPRVRHDGSSTPTGAGAEEGGGRVLLESGFSAATRDELAKRGHQLQDGDGGFGGYQAIWFDAERGMYIGASESRKDGMALGY